MKKNRFNDNWFFALCGGGALEGLLGGGPAPEPVTLPHDAEICFPRNPDEPVGAANGYFHAQSVNYTKQFAVDAADADKLFYLEFEGVYENAFVYINNAFAGKHPYGYSNFYLDITKYIVPGEDNTVKVIVKNGVPSGRWYTGGGIYRDVNLMISDRLHILPDGVQLGTIELDEELARIRVQTQLEYRGTGTREITLTNELIDAEGNAVASDVMPITLTEGDNGTYRQWLTVFDPKTWDAEHPYLYTYRTTVKEDEKILDEEDGTFGIRKIRLDAKHGLRINGKTVKLAGGCLHHDCGITGTAEFTHAEEVRVRNLKKAGFNAIRSSHHPMSRKLIEECDRQGLYVMDEFADVWTTTKVDFDYGIHMSEWWENDTENLVRKDYNHPSVILYSIGNEIPETGNKYDTQWGKKLSDKIRELDDTRFIVNSMNLMLAIMDQLPKIMARIATEKGIDLAAQESGEINSLMSGLGDALALIGNSEEAGLATAEASGQVDVTGYNYTAGRYEIDHEKYPNRVMVGSETNPGELDVNWELVEKLPYVIGDFDWTAYDYLGEAGIGRITHGEEGGGMNFYAPYPTKSAYCGDIDLLGDMRPVAFWRATIWGNRTDPYIAVQPPQFHGQKVNKTQWRMSDTERSWTFSGQEGNPVLVEVYAPAEEVELFVNGTSIGRKAVGETKKNIAYFETVYQKGSIEAVAYKGGKESGHDLLKTAGDNIRLQAAADVESIPADGSDIGYVEICVTDEEGTIHPEAAPLVRINIDGPGTVLGYGSADPDSEENYYDTSARPFHGRLRAAIRGTGEKGIVTVNLSAEELGNRAVIIRTV